MWPLCDDGEPEVGLAGRIHSLQSVPTTLMYDLIMFMYCTRPRAALSGTHTNPPACPFGLLHSLPRSFPSVLVEVLPDPLIEPWLQPTEPLAHPVPPCCSAYPPGTVHSLLC